MKYVNKIALQDIINRIQNDGKLSNSRSMQGKVYTEEKIIMTAAQLKSVTPHKYKELEQLIKRHKADCLRRSEAFYQQAKFMEDFTDDFDMANPPIKEYFYYPTYDVLDKDAKRCYFSWRTQCRAGVYGDAPNTFIFLYIYELLHNIGVENPEDGYARLLEINRQYSRSGSLIDYYLQPWLHDYIIYYNLDRSLLSGYAKYDTKVFDRDFAVFLRWADCADSELFSSLVGLSSYNPLKGKTYKKYPCEYEKITAAVMRALIEYFARHGKKSFRERCFGIPFRQSYYIFERANFYDYLARNDYEYVLSDMVQYDCETDQYGTFWHENREYAYAQPSKFLGDIMRTVENALRVHFGITPLLKEVKVLKTVQKIISQEIANFVQAQREAAARAELAAKLAQRPKIDVSKLAGIRAAAAGTREKLLTEEERSGMAQTDVATVASAPREVASGELPTFALEPERNLFSSEVTPQKAAVGKNDAVTADGVVQMLAPTELEFLQMILRGEDVKTYAKAKKLMPELLVDAINEKLYDEIGDNVLEFAGDEPVVIEDYLDDVRKILGVE